MKKVSGDGLIFLILDVFYQETGKNTIAHVAGLRFTGIEQHTILNEYKITVENVAPYQSGEFYKREMPCLLALIEQVTEPFDVIIIDGFVFLDSKNKAGLGKHLYDNLTDKKPIIGIAKNPFYGIDDCHAVYRGKSKNPLYVTTQDIELVIAKDWVKNLQGNFRLPDIITKVDKLSREKTLSLYWALKVLTCQISLKTMLYKWSEKAENAQRFLIYNTGYKTEKFEKSKC